METLSKGFKAYAGEQQEPEVEKGRGEDWEESELGRV